VLFVRLLGLVGWLVVCTVPLIQLSNFSRTQPLQLWEQKAERHGNDDDEEVAIQLITDSEIQSSVLDIRGINLSTTYIACPADPRKTLGIILPYFAMTVKNVMTGFILLSQSSMQQLV